MSKIFDVTFLEKKNLGPKQGPQCWFKTSSKDQL